MKEDDDEEMNLEEDATQYGEFISTYFAWRTLNEQKKISKRLSNITDKDKE